MSFENCQSLLARLSGRTVTRVSALELRLKAAKPLRETPEDVHQGE